MAQRVEVLLTDDLTGSRIRAGKGETMAFSLDGVAYEIDLSTKNATALRKTLAPYVEAGRRKSPSRPRTHRTETRLHARTVRKWARANSYEVNARGRMSREILEAFAAAN